MYSRFPFTMENIPRQKSFMCLSLKFGCIFSALITILYSVLALGQSTAVMFNYVPTLSWNNIENVATYCMVIAVIIIHFVTIFLTTLMLIGTLREKYRLMRPWLIWTSVQLTAYILMFVFLTVMNMVSQMVDSSLVVIFIEFFALLVRFYTLVLVVSYYEVLEEESEFGERLKTLDNETWYHAA